LPGSISSFSLSRRATASSPQRLAGSRLVSAKLATMPGAVHGKIASFTRPICASFADTISGVAVIPTA
jgi:hypothetical protein